VYDLELGDGGVAQALDLGQPGLRPGDYLSERTEFGDQLLGQRFDVALWNGAEQHQFEQLVVADCLGAGLAEAGAQPFTVAVIIRRSLGKAALPLAAATLCRHEIYARAAQEARL
jgi:hypothetical protein